MTKLYVGNLPYSYNDDSLKALFANYGNILSASIIMDRQSGRSKGFGFVEIEDDSAAQQAITEMNGKDVDGRALVVSVARPMSDQPRRGGFDRGNRGGFNR